MMSNFSVKKPYTIFVAVILVILLGVISFTNMTTDLLPSMELPYAVIMTTYVGASSEKVETTITKPIEQGMATVSNVVNISSISSENSSMVILEFSNDTNMDSALIEINSKLDLIKSAFKEETIGAPMVSKINPDMLPIMLCAVDVKDKEATEITKLVQDKLLPQLERIEGVASVEATGLIEDKIQVLLDQEKIDALNSRILENIDKQLAKAETELNSAQYKIQTGKKQLEEQAKVQTAKIVDGTSAILNGKEQISELQSDITNKQTALNFTKTTLTTSIAEFDKNLQSLNKQKQELVKLGNSITPIQKQQLKKLEETITEVTKNKELASSKLKEVTNGLASMEVGKAELQKQKDNLQEREKLLEQAKTTLNMELSKASATLMTSQAQLEEGRKEFENAREEAYKKASLEGVITQKMIADVLGAENFSMPAGYIQEGNNNLLVKIGDKFTSIEELKELTLFSLEIEGLENITLQDIAQVGITNNQESIYAKVNGNDGVVLTFQKQSTASTAEVCKQIEKTMKTIEGQEENVRFTTLMNQGVYIDIIIDSVLQNLMYGAILAVIILLLFLKDAKPTIIIALSIPISLTFAITLMYFTGVSINIISLSGLALGVGMLVDNSIVVIENIYRLRKEGKSILEAAVQGAANVAGAIVASTLTTVCVFLPIVFIQGMSRQLFSDMGLTIAYSLLASLIVALTLVPAMASKMFVKTTQKPTKLLDRLLELYERALNWLLNHKVLIISFVLIMLVLSIFLTTKMGTAFIPSAEGKQISVNLEMPKESGFDDTKVASNEFLEQLLTLEDISMVGAITQDLAQGTGNSSDKNKVSMYIMLKEERKTTNKELEKEILALAENKEYKVEVSTSNMDLSAMSGSGIELKIKGKEIDTLRRMAEDIGTLLENTEGILEVNNGISDPSMEVRLVVNKNEAMKKGLTVAGIYAQITSELTKEKQATTLSIENKEYPVMVVKTDTLNKENLLDLPLSANTNAEESKIRLGDVASLEEAEGLASISHDNQERYLTVTGKIDPDHNIRISKSTV